MDIAALQTELHQACESGDIKAIRQTLTCKALNDNQEMMKKILLSTNVNGEPCLHLVCANSQLTIKNVNQVFRIFKGVPFDELWCELVCMKDNANKTILHLLCQNENVMILKVLIRFIKGDSPLTMRKLVDIQSDGMTAIEAMTRYRHFHCLPTLLGGPYELSKIILDSNNIAKILLGVCQHGDKSAVESIMRAAFQIQKRDQNNNSLRRIFKYTDDKGKRILHIACSRGDVEVLGCILSYLRQMGVDITQSIQFDRDNKGRTAFHKCCQLGQYRSVQMICDSIPDLACDFMTRLLCEQDNKNATPLSEAVENGHHKTVKVIMNMAVKSKCLRKLLLECRYNNDQTLLHRACHYKNERGICLNVVLDEVKDDPKVFRDLFLSTDECNRTFLCYLYLGDSSEYMNRLLLKSASKWDRNEPDFRTHPQDSICYQLLHGTYKKRPVSVNASQNSVRCPQQSICSQLLPGSDEKHLNVSDHADFAVLQKLPQKHHQTLTTKTSALTAIFEIFDNDDDDDERQPCDFALFQTEDGDDTGLLSSMCNVNCIDLIQHKYAQNYVYACWLEYGRYCFFTNMVLYVMMLLMLTTFVVSHRLDVNGTSNIGLVFTKASWIHPVVIVLILFSLLTLLYEILQMINRSGYFKQIHNYVDLIVCLTSLCLPISNLLIDYNIWHHRIGAIVIGLAWVNATWMITRAPSKDNNIFDKIIRKIILTFSMLFYVMRRGCYVLPVFSMLTMTFALCFHILFQTQEPFSNIANSLLRTIGMTIGELDMASMFFPDSESELPSFKTISCILFTIFLYMMTISAMNLLVGMAVGDINELSEKGEVMAFETWVDLIQESRGITSMFKKREKQNNAIPGDASEEMSDDDVQQGYLNQ